jgi:hypothetical protein
MQKTGIEVFSFMPKGTRPLLIWSVMQNGSGETYRAS